MAPKPPSPQLRKSRTGPRPVPALPFRKHPQWGRFPTCPPAPPRNPPLPHLPPAGLRVLHHPLPVIYWFHGYGERSNQAPANKDYDSGSDYNGDSLANFVASHDVIIVKPDGYNPRTPNENYPRPSHHAHLRPLDGLRLRRRIGKIHAGKNQQNLPSPHDKARGKSNPTQ